MNDGSNGNLDLVIVGSVGLDTIETPSDRREEILGGSVSYACSAASFGDLDQLRRLHEHHADLSQGDYDGRTPLHLAVSEGHTEAVRYLVKLGVDVNCRDRWGNTPLIDALKQDHREIAEILQTAGR